MADDAFFNERGFLFGMLLNVRLVAGQVVVVVEVVWLCSSFDSCGFDFGEELKSEVIILGVVLRQIFGSRQLTIGTRVLRRLGFVLKERIILG